MLPHSNATAPPPRSHRGGRAISLAEALASVPGPGGERFATVFQRGSLAVEVYAPRGVDPQQPHTRDEAYVVVQGTGEFVHGERRDPVAPGSFLFVPAGLPHRFEAFSDDLVVWVLFYGPEGGEVT
jgi:mannose-6-phosphate isomerase-like protein (cupin superfamily)